MNSLRSESMEVRELWRLENLLPADLRSQVVIVHAQAVNPALVTTKKIDKNRFLIEIDLLHWQQLTINQRDLLFWHEAARIQNRTIKKFLWEMPVIATGLSISLMEVMTQNLLSLSVALLITGLVSYQLYQRKRGERSLREATSADRLAIDLAIQFGYSFDQACRSLQDALNSLTKQTSNPLQWKKYQVRLRVLEILVEKDRKAQHSEALNLGIAGKPVGTALHLQ